MEMKDSKLFSPLKVGRTVLQNRIGLAPMSMDYEAADGTVPKKHENIHKPGQHWAHVGKKQIC